jgi:hypothetical protein
VLARLRDNLDDLYIMSMPPTDIDIEDQVFMPNPLVVIAASILLSISLLIAPRRGGLARWLQSRRTVAAWADGRLLEVALRLDVGYIGAMGSRRTHDDRLARLREAGLTDAELAGLSSPIGLDLGARTPEETAVSIAAEIIAHRWGGGGLPLSVTAGRIHHDDDVIQASPGELSDH